MNIAELDVKTTEELAQLVRDMDLVRSVCSAALSLREEHRRRTRLPLRELIYAGAGEVLLEPYRDLIRDETNVKCVTLTPDFTAYAVEDLKLNARVLGPRYGPRLKTLLQAVRDAKWSREPGSIASSQR